MNVSRTTEHKLDPRWIVTATELAGYFDVAKSTITEWKRKGMPTFGSRFILPACMTWYFCFGPHRSEKLRDEYLWTYIRSFTADE